MSLAPGVRLGPYEIVGLIGAGGMGVVYRARDTRLGRSVAIKIVEELSADSFARTRLLREAQHASALNHPNVCTIHEIGDADGKPFIVMEFVDGTPLSEVIPSDGLPIEKVVRFGMQIADAVAHAHDKGIVHRDLKPSNIVITPQGLVKVLDFGLARRTWREGAANAPTLQVTHPGTIAGTIAYMAPEVLQGKPGDARSDIWSVGIILHELTTGVRPFKGRTEFELSSQILREPAPPLPAHVPAGLSSTVARCLRKDAAARYQQAGEIRAALEAGRAEVGPDEGGQFDPPLISGVPRRSARLRLWPSVTAAVLIILLAALIGLNLGGWRDRVLGRSSAGRMESLAVLPLENLSGDPAQQYFADGMTEAVISNLAQMGGLKVISRTSAMRYKKTTKTLPEIARELGVDAVIEGSVLRAGDRVRIMAQLIDSRTDRYLWASSYERDLRDVLTLQREVARAIAEEIRMKLTPEQQARLAAVRSVNPGVYDAYLKGRASWYIWSEDGFRKGIEYFARAIQQDPNFAPAYAGLADCWMGLGFTGLVPPREAFPQAMSAAEKAVVLDAELAEAYISIGYIKLNYDWDWPAAERAFQRALKLNPGLAEAHHAQAFYLRIMQRPGEALAEMKRAWELDPLTFVSDVGGAYRWAGQIDEGIEWHRRAIELDPDSVFVYADLGAAYLDKGMFQDAIAVLTKAIAMSKGDQTAVGPEILARAYALAGQKDEARKLLKEWSHKSTFPDAVAAAYAALDMRDEAFAWLEKAFTERNGQLIFLKVDRKFERLQSDGRFDNLARRVGLP